MNTTTIQDLLKKRILVLDGAMGTMIQRFNLSEEDYRGKEFADLPGQMKGNNDILVITHPDVIRCVHAEYLDAGADIIETNTLNATAISMSDYGIEKHVRELNLAAARLARDVADEYTRKNPDKPRFVAGSIGPTNKTASMSADVNNPAFRLVTFDELVDAYDEQIEALIDGGVDVLLIETIFDTLNLKAALFASEKVFVRKNRKTPIMVSATLSGKSGRLLSGQTLEAFLASVQHADILSIGLNCSFGASDMKPFLKVLSKKAPYFVSAYPNAGLPNCFGEYDETPEKMAEQIKEYIDEGLVNIIGGCCGTTPAHIAQYSKLIENAKPHIPAEKPDSLWLSGLELLEIKPENNFVNIGERCNVAGSRKFLRLIKEKKYEEALEIARKQVEDGAQVIDVNMDEGMLDAEKEMVHFLNLIFSDPDIARVPVMIDSSQWNVIEAGLKCLQGKSIVNSISLKEGEEEFLRRAELIKLYGAAVVVMAFDEKGQADVFERKIEICERAYRLLVDKANFNPNDIIFDPNVLAVATGMETDAIYGLDFIRAVDWIKTNLPDAKVSGGISNLSFSFRGNDYIREAMHSVFLYYAIGKGMDMGIVNPSSSMIYEDIPKDVSELVEDVILNRRKDATERLIEYAQNTKADVGERASGKEQDRRAHSVEERLEQALIKGIGDFLEEDLTEALKKYPKPVDIIDKVLMCGMNKVGELFGAGKMFLPQVVKTARTMKKAVAILQPFIEAEKNASGSTSKGKFLLATVKGDVHDIGKNIVSVVLSCNNFEVIDLGVMVPPEVIIQKAREENVDFIGLSGLITPSLEEMCIVAEEMEKAGFTIPLFIGGAATSKLHTAVKIAPKYSGPTLRLNDASRCPVAATRLINSDTKDEYIAEIKAEQEQLRNYRENAITLIPIEEAEKTGFKIDWEGYNPPIPKIAGIQEYQHIPLEKVIPYINWQALFATWKLSKQAKKETDKLFHDANQLLTKLITEKHEPIKALLGFFPAYSSGETIVINNERIPMLRQQTKKSDPNVPYYSLVDFVAPENSGKNDRLGVFVVTGGAGIETLIEKYQQEGDDYNVLLLQSIADRFAEAAIEYLHESVSNDFREYAFDENCSQSARKSIRPAVGFPSIPDQSVNFQIDNLLNMSKIGVTLTENGAMYPNATISGFFFLHPHSRYFSVGKIDERQLKRYAENKGQSVEETKRWLGNRVQ